MADKILTFNGKTISGHSGTGIVIVKEPEPTLPPRTLRFQFSKSDYDPIDAGVGSSGTWTKVTTAMLNTWDWTNENSSWASSFKDAFTEPTVNEVSIIEAGDTHSVTDFSRLLQNCTGIKEVCYIDTSGASNVLLMFSGCQKCEKFSNLDFSNASDVRGVFQECRKMKTAPNIILPTTHTYSLQNFFYHTAALEYVPLYNTSYCINMDNMFEGVAPTTRTPIKNIPNFDTSRVTSMKKMFEYCAIENMPDFNTSNVTSMYYMFFDCRLLKQIRQYNINSVTDVDSMFAGCRNIKYGIIEMYNNLLTRSSAITIHDRCFYSCGVDTEEGRAALSQIPTDWGGTMTTSSNS